MTDMTIQSQLDQVLALAEKATPGEWMLATSCSWRRIIAERSHAPVIVPTTQRTDNHPDLDCGEDYVNAELAIAAVNFLRQHGPAIRTAVGGEAVAAAWTTREQLKLLDNRRTKRASMWSARNKERGDIPLYIRRKDAADASPTATVDVGALEVNKNRWTCPNCNKVNPTFDPWCSACETPQPAASIDASSLRELAEDWRNRVRAIGRDTGGYKTCADELAALIGEEA